MKITRLFCYVAVAGALLATAPQAEATSQMYKRGFVDGIAYERNKTETRDTRHLRYLLKQNRELKEKLQAIEGRRARATAARNANVATIDYGRLRALADDD